VGFDVLDVGRARGDEAECAYRCRESPYFVAAVCLRLTRAQGEEDQFYKDGQLRPEAFQEAVKKTGYGPDQVNVRMQPGYDHSYYFVSTAVPFLARVTNDLFGRFQPLQLNTSSVCPFAPQA
jgi:hypothetical protein